MTTTLITIFFFDVTHDSKVLLEEKLIHPSKLEWATINAQKRLRNRIAGELVAETV